MQHKYVVNYAWLLTHFASSFVAFAHVGRLLRGAAVDFEVFVRPTEAIHCTDVACVGVE